MEIKLANLYWVSVVTRCWMFWFTNLNLWQEGLNLLLTAKHRNLIPIVMNLYLVTATCQTVIRFVFPSGIMSHGFDNKLQTVHAIIIKNIFLCFAVSSCHGSNFILGETYPSHFRAAPWEHYKWSSTASWFNVNKRWYPR